MAQGAATSKGYFNEVNLLSVPGREGLRTRAPLAVGRDRLQVFQSGAQKIYTARQGDTRDIYATNLGTTYHHAELVELWRLVEEAPVG